VPEGRRRPRTLLEQLVWQREATYEEQAAEFERLARQLNEPATLSVRHLQRLASGERSGERATPSLRRVMRQFYGHPLDELLGAPRTAEASGEQLIIPPQSQGADPRQLAATAAHDSLAFASWADADRVAPTLLEHVNYELGRIAVDYVATPLLPLLQDLIAIRNTTFELLRDGANPKQARELFFFGGTACLLLAHATQNLGDPSSAMAQARTAWACAEQADHPGLRSWVRGAQALIAEGSRRTKEAIAFARAGQEHAVSTDARAKLAALEARALARAGDSAATIGALLRVEKARDATDASDDLSDFGGLLTFPHAKQLYYVGGSLTLLGEHSKAEQTSLAAIEMYETGPPEDRSYGDEALARVDVATARLAQDDLDGAAAALAPVLALPGEQRIRQICDGLTRFSRQLTLPRYAQARDAKQLVVEINGFTAPRVTPPRLEP
jgi:hypothetical protein